MLKKEISIFQKILIAFISSFLLVFVPISIVYITKNMYLAIPIVIAVLVIILPACAFLFSRIICKRHVASSFIFPITSATLLALCVLIFTFNILSIQNFFTVFNYLISASVTMVRFLLWTALWAFLGTVTSKKKKLKLAESNDLNVSTEDETQQD